MEKSSKAEVFIVLNYISIRSGKRVWGSKNCLVF